MRYQLLANIIKEKTFKQKEIKEVSLASTGKEVSWMFDFKSVALSNTFLREYAKAFWDAFAGYGGKAIQIGGMESGAIPLIAGLTIFAPSGVDVNPFYIRKSRKKTDLANLIEGELMEDIPIVLVDDILNNGTTMKKQIAILKEEGHKVTDIFTCLRFRDMKAYKAFTDQGTRIQSIFELDDLSELLPVKNLEAPTVQALPQRYQAEYKVTLTKHPNLYAVVPKSGPVLSGEHIFMGADDGTFYCLSKKDGSVVWTYKVVFGAGGKRIFSTCAVYDGCVMFGAYDGNFYCLDQATGKQKWVFMDGDWIGSSPCVDSENQVVFIGLEFGLFNKQGGVAAIDIKTGKAKWKYYSMKGFTHASPAYNAKHGMVVCGCNDNSVYAFDAASGNLLWTFETGGEVKYGATFDDQGDLVVVGSMDGGLYALSVKDGSLYYRFEAHAGFYSTPVVSENFVFIGSLDKNVYCFNLEKKHTEWAFETSGRIFASPLLYEESIFIGSNDGCLYELDERTGKRINSIQLTERIVNRVEAERNADGKRVLYVPTHMCELYKIYL